MAFIGIGSPDGLSSPIFIYASSKSSVMIYSKNVCVCNKTVENHWLLQGNFKCWNERVPINSEFLTCGCRINCPSDEQVTGIIITTGWKDRCLNISDWLLVNTNIVNESWRSTIVDGANSKCKTRFSSHNIGCDLIIYNRKYISAFSDINRFLIRLNGSAQPISLGFENKKLDESHQDERASKNSQPIVGTQTPPFMRRFFICLGLITFGA